MRILSEKTISRAIGRKINSIRVGRKLSLRDLEARCRRVTNATICQIENGRGATVGTLYDIAKGLGVDVKTLLP